jgi:peptidoglycan hydrolase-like protein with peptidoglycan-binding domain
MPLLIGHLDPVDAVSGQAARLNNLGYNAGSGEGEDVTRFEIAVQEFQVDHGLNIDGICGTETQAKLQELYGS